MKRGEVGWSAQVWRVGHQCGVSLSNVVRSICEGAGDADQGDWHVGVRRCELQVTCVGSAGLDGGVGAGGTC